MGISDTTERTDRNVPGETVRITEDGLLLRPWRPEDAKDVYRACQDPDIQRWASVPTPYGMDHAIQFVTELAPRAWAAGTGAPFAVCDAETGELLASCGLVSIDPVLRSAEVGYWTAPWARGRGVASRATRAVCRWAFRERGLRRIIWQAEVGNHASRMVALRAGFLIEGRLRIANPHPRGVADAWVGSLLPGDLADGAAVTGRAEPGSLEARRSAVFGTSQPVLFARTPAGEELRLRPLDERDIDPVVRTCQDPETLRWTSVPDPYQRTDAESFVHGYAPTVWRRGTGAVFAIADNADGYAGIMELRVSPADPLVADLGFMVAPWARGRGYCPAAVIAVCTWGFTALGLARIEWRAHVGNLRSRRVVEKAGFTFEGTARQALEHRGTRADAWVAALLPADLGIATVTD
jgi:RimJ/RimL family protein N-acetyltransferase